MPLHIVLCLSFSFFSSFPAFEKDKRNGLAQELRRRDHDDELHQEKEQQKQTEVNGGKQWFPSRKGDFLNWPYEWAGPGHNGMLTAESCWI